MASPLPSKIVRVCVVLTLLASAACRQSPAQEDSGAAGAATGFPLMETATDNVFKPDAYTVDLGQPYTLTMENKGDAIHNWHILDLKRVSGKEIETALTDPHKSASVSFTIARAGVYHFQCDVHPDTMKGTITVR